MCAIYLRHGSDLVAMTEQSYDAESVLQELLAEYPHLLAGDEDESSRSWLLVKREIGIASEEDSGDRWSLDHLFLDDEGTPTLVEVKRSSDSRIRRSVVGQMLDYASNAAEFWSVEAIRASFDAHAGDPEARLAEFLGADSDPEEFWERVNVHLQAGRLRLVFVADRIPSELQRIVEFLNEQMTGTEVIALEVRQYVDKGGDRQTLVPRLVGRTEAAKHAKSAGKRSARKWDEASILARMREQQPEAVPIAERILAWCHQFDPALLFTFGTGAKDASCFPGLKGDSAYCFPFSVDSTGRVTAHLGTMRSAPYPPFHLRARRLELLERLNALPLGEPIEFDRTEKFPSRPLTDLAPPGRLEGFLEIYEWALRAALASGIGLAGLDVAREEQAQEHERPTAA
jgi:hypothetical protein